MRIAIFTEYYPDHEDPASGVYVHLRAAAYRATGHQVQVFRVRKGPPRSVEYGGIPIATAETEALHRSWLEVRRRGDQLFEKPILESGFGGRPPTPQMADVRSSGPLVHPKETKI